MTTGDLTLTALPVIHTPSLRDAMAQYRADFGFSVQQHIEGVLAVLRLQGLRLHLWQRGGTAGGPLFRPGQHRAAVDDVFGLHGAMNGPARGALSGPPMLKPWGAWEFSLCDAHGNLLHLVQWAVDGQKSNFAATS